MFKTVNHSVNFPQDCRTILINENFSNVEGYKTLTEEVFPSIKEAEAFLRENVKNNDGILYTVYAKSNYGDIIILGKYEA